MNNQHYQSTNIVQQYIINNILLENIRSGHGLVDKDARFVIVVQGLNSANVIGSVRKRF